MLQHEDITLRTAFPTEMESLYRLLTTDEAWTAYNGPYFGYTRPTRERFEEVMFPALQTGGSRLLIDYQEEAVGMVSYYWKDEKTRWLEIGIVIYASHLWGRHIGRKALIAWISHLFNTFPDIERVGLTTWSGNPRMIASAAAIGMQVEGQIRKVRYYNDVYYDSVMMGVLREEWENRPWAHKKGQVEPEKPSQSFRAGVGAVILNGDGMVLAFKRNEENGGWQLPQGGMQEGEEPLATLYREVREETGLLAETLQAIELAPLLRSYEYPPEKKRDNNRRGQTQTWFFFRFVGNENQITLGDQKEFCAWRWMTITELIEQVVPFKAQVYKEIQLHLGRLKR